MSSTKQTVKIWAPLALAFLAAAPALQAQGTLDQFWPEVKAYIKTGETNRIYLQWAGTVKSAEGYADGQYGAHMDFYFSPLWKGREQRNPDASRNKMLMMRTGYYFAQTPPGSKDPFQEHTALTEATPRFFLPKLILMENRFRFDLRFVDGEFLPRFRDRVRIERTFNVKGIRLTPYAEFEAFYDWRYNTFHRFRYDPGLEWVLSNHLVLEGYYLHQQDSRASPKGIDVAGLVLQFYFQ
jgi:hypothetical protein